MGYLSLFKERADSADKTEDPRPDLTGDSPLWESVLDQAREDRELHGLLHGLRCGGALLGRRENGSLKLDYTPLLNGWEKDELLKNWLEPNKTKIAAIFKAVAERMNSDVGN